MTIEESTGAWVPEACTLPTAEQPLRVAEFEGLFVAALRAVNRVAPTALRLVLDASAEEVARELADRETACCSFFGFAFDHDPAGQLLMTVTVPAAHVVVLDRLAGQAAVAGGMAA